MDATAEARWFASTPESVAPFLSFLVTSLQLYFN